jgi:endoglucanase
MELKKVLKTLCECPTASGKEASQFKIVNELASPYFDLIERDNMGNIILTKLSGKDNAKKLMLDAHFDVIGLMVTKIHENGFLSVHNIGGIDLRTLPSSEVTIHGKEDIYGLVVSTPPHLTGGKTTVPEIEGILIDTGYKKEDLEKIVSVGDTITINGDYMEMENGYIMSSFLDNRSCGATCIHAIANTERKDLEYDVFVVISAGEEIGRMQTRVAAFNIEPDIIITTDVNFAKEPNIEVRHSIECKKGPSVDISALTNRDLSRGIIKLAKENGIPCQIVIEPMGTGTNNDILAITGKGAKTVVMSLPLKSMHTSCECVNTLDMEYLSQLLSLIAKTKESDLQ